MVMIDIELSEELAQKAKAAGLLNSEKISELIESELARQRQAAAGRLLTIMDELREAAHEDFGDMTEDEFSALANELVRTARAEQSSKGDEPSA